MQATQKKPITKLPDSKNPFYMLKETHQKGIHGTLQGVIEEGQK